MAINRVGGDRSRQLARLLEDAPLLLDELAVPLGVALLALLLRLLRLVAELLDLFLRELLSCARDRAAARARAAPWPRRNDPARAPLNARRASDALGFRV